MPAGFVPERLGDAERINARGRPPGRFLADPMDFAVVHATERDRELVARLAPKRSRLRVAQMMWVGGLATADQAGLAGHVAQVLLAAVAARLGDGERVGILRCRTRCGGNDKRRVDSRRSSSLG